MLRGRDERLHDGRGRAAGIKRHSTRAGFRAVIARDAFEVRWELEGEQARSRELVARLERLSALDELTGLANRRSWDDSLDATG